MQRALLTQPEVDRVRRFGAEAVVADFVAADREVWSVRVQLGGLRVTLRVSELQRAGQRVAERPQQAAGQRERGAGVVTGGGVGVDLLALQARAQVHGQTVEAAAFNEEDRIRIGLRRRHVGLVAARLEIRARVLHAERAAPARERRVAEVQPRVVAGLVEARADLAALEFLVAVVVVGGAQQHALDESAELGPLGLEVEAVLLLVDADGFLLFLRRACNGLFLLVRVLARAGQSVVRFVPGPGQAHGEAVARPRAPERAAFGLAVRVLHRAAREIGFLALRLGLAARLARPRVAGDVVVVGLAVVAVRVQAEGAGPSVDTRGPAALLVHRLAAQLRHAGPAGLEADGDAAVDHVDDTAHGTAAVEQRGRALQYLHLVGEDLLDGHRVVGTQAADVERTHAVLQHQHALAGEPADDGPAGTRAEEGRGQAGLLGEGLAEAARDAAREVVAAQHHGRLNEVGGPDAQRARGHDDLLELAVLAEGGGRGEQAGHGQRRVFSVRHGMHSGIGSNVAGTGPANTGTDGPGRARFSAERARWSARTECGANGGRRQRRGGVKLRFDRDLDAWHRRRDGRRGGAAVEARAERAQLRHARPAGPVLVVAVRHVHERGEADRKRERRDQQAQAIPPGQPPGRGERGSLDRCVCQVGWDGPPKEAGKLAGGTAGVKAA